MAVTNTNRWIGTGNLTRDPEEFANGAGVKFSIASNESYFSKKDDKRVEYVSYFDITVWGKAGEPVMKFLSKGSKVAIDGRLKQERWEKDGQRQSKLVIVAQSVEFITPKGGERAASSDIPADDFASGSSAGPADDDDIPF